jgi:queuine tRNA-ribosyltransferase
MGKRFDMSEWLRFDLQAEDPGCKARAGVVVTPRGTVPTPVFMPVGTSGTVKGLDPAHLSALGAGICLGNTYHLMNRPGHERVRALGGLHKMMSWDGVILTDSGGFQVFSLAKLRKVTNDGVRFRSHLDGNLLELTPESAIAVQEALGSDIMMPLDICPPHPCSEKEMTQALSLTTRWAKRCLAARKHGALFAITQGGVDVSRRRQHIEQLIDLEVDGFSIGGLSVGEPNELMYEVTDAVADTLPKHKPRYLMGVGTPIDLLTAVEHGVDMFDCVMPTRHARNGMAFTWNGPVIIKHQAHTDDDRPLDESCPCPTCTRFSRAYLRHLYKQKEMLAHMALTVHNIHFYLELMREARAAILEGRYVEFKRKFISGYTQAT